VNKIGLDYLPAVGSAAFFREPRAYLRLWDFRRKDRTMPRLTQLLPRYSKHKASGQAVVKFGGKLHYLGPYGSKKSKAKYQRLVGEWLTADRHAPTSTHDSGNLTVVELLARFMPFAKRHYRKHGELTNEIENIKYAIRPLNALYGRTRVKDFGPLALKALQAQMIDQGLARTTINARIGIIRRVFRWGVGEELCPPSVIHGLNAVTGLPRQNTGYDYPVFLSSALSALLAGDLN
jgi:hypothetical protein